MVNKQGGVRTPDFKMTIGGVSFTEKELKSRVHEITVEQLSDGASSYKVILDDTGDFFSGGKNAIREGMECEIELGYTEADGGTEIVMKGIVSGVHPERKEFSRKMFSVTGFDMLSKLTRGRKRRSWESIKDSDIAAEIAHECGLKPSAEDTGLVLPYVVQNNENDLNFLLERARRYGYEVRVDNENNLVFRKPVDEEPVATFQSDGVYVKQNGGLLLQRMDFNTSTMNMPTKVVVRSYDPKTAAPIVAEATRETSDSMEGRLSATDAAKQSSPHSDNTLQISDQPVCCQEEAALLAQSILDQRAGEFMTGNGRCAGNPKIQARQRIRLENFGSELDGVYYVKSAKHSLRVGSTSSAGYWTEFCISRSGR